MIKVYTAENDICIDKTETLRYMGAGNIEDAFIETVNKCIDEVKDAAEYKACYDIYSVEHRGENVVQIGRLNIKSDSLARHLSDCKKAVVFTATAGFGIDRLLGRYSSVSPLKALAVQAAGAAAIEKWCDHLCKKFEAEIGLPLKPRFSPGYGDVSINLQKDILSMLDSTRKIGVSLTQSLMMLPTKSVSAIVGVKTEMIK